MNKNTKIKVKTPVGISPSENIGGSLAQGSPEACIISSVNTDNGMDVAFQGSDGHAKYVDLKIPYEIYMDDINKLSENVAAAQDANNRIEDMLEKNC